MSEKPTLPEGPGFGLTFLYYFSGIALVTTLLAVKTLGLSLDTGIPNQFGLVFGAIGGVLGATFNRSTVLDIPFSGKKNFKQQLEAVLDDMGYTQDANANLDGILVYRRSAIRQIFSGKIYVLLEDKQAHISSRASHIRTIRRKLNQP
jgi:hypothetical protein